MDTGTDRVQVARVWVANPLTFLQLVAGVALGVVVGGGVLAFLGALI